MTPKQIITRAVGAAVIGVVGGFVVKELLGDAAKSVGGGIILLAIHEVANARSRTGSTSRSSEMGRSGRDVRHLDKLIPRLPIDQSVWKHKVCYWHAKGEPVTVAVPRATAAAREADPPSSLATTRHPGALTRALLRWLVGLGGMRLLA
jgi:hypothetical protein